MWVQTRGLWVCQTQKFMIFWTKMRDVAGTSDYISTLAVYTSKYTLQKWTWTSKYWPMLYYIHADAKVQNFVTQKSACNMEKFYVAGTKLMLTWNIMVACFSCYVIPTAPTKSISFNPKKLTHVELWKCLHRYTCVLKCCRHLDNGHFVAPNFGIVIFFFKLLVYVVIWQISTCLNNPRVFNVLMIEIGPIIR